MKKILAKIFKSTVSNLVEELVGEVLRSDEFRQKMTKTVNEAINLPALSEEQEEKLIRKILDIVAEFVAKKI